MLTASDTSLPIGQQAGAAASTGLADMVGHGLHHVLKGADHLLFLLTLLLVAPLVGSPGGGSDARVRSRRCAGSSASSRPSPSGAR